MSLVRFVFLPLLNVLGLVVVSEHTLLAGERFCDACFLNAHTLAILVPTTVIQPADKTHAAHVAPMESEAKLIVNCPAESRVTIDGRVTHASGETRQYRLLFRGDEHKFRVKIRLRDNDEKATYEFDHPMSCRRHQTIVLSVARDQMQKTPDATSAKSDGAPPAMPEVPTAIRNQEVQPASPLKRVVSSQTKVLNAAKAETTRLADAVSTKATRRDAAARIRKLTEDAYQLKTVEVNTAANESAAILAAKRLEAKKLELELHRAREVEQGASAELAAVQHELSVAEGRVREADNNLKATKWSLAREEQITLIGTERAKLKRLADTEKTKTQRFEAAVRLRQRAEVSKDDAEISLAREAEQRATRELETARDQSATAQKRVHQAEETLGRITDRTISVE